MDIMKICSQCNEEKYIKEFQKAKGYRDGYTGQCKECRYKNSRRWLKSHPENEKRHKKSSLRWYKEKGREYHAQYRDENREKVREATRRYAALHLEERREGYRRRRAQIRGTSSDITVEWLKELRSITPNCELCECELLYDTQQHDHHKANLDHIIPLNVGGTHTRDNVRYICYLCNLGRPKNGSDI